MSIESVAIIGIIGWLQFWNEYRFSRRLKKLLDEAHDGWKVSLEENGEILHICQMQARLLEHRNDDGEEWKR